MQITFSLKKTDFEIQREARAIAAFEALPPKPQNHSNCPVYKKYLITSLMAGLHKQGEQF